MDTNDLQKRFTYHPPKVSNVDKFSLMRANALGLAELLNELVPEGREKSLAITKLEEVVMWANAGIARED